MRIFRLDEQRLLCGGDRPHVGFSGIGRVGARDGHGQHDRIVRAIRLIINRPSAHAFFGVIGDVFVEARRLE